MVCVSVEVLNETPLSFLWHANRVQINQITDHWSETGRWWDGEQTCEFFQVFTASGMFLLCLRISDNAWYAKPVQ